MENGGQNYSTTTTNGNGGGQRRGALIVLEGLDRSGKTTQAKLLVEHLQRIGHRARMQRFPDREEPTTGAAIDNFLRCAKSVNESKEAIHLLFAANRWLLSAKMREELSAGQHLIVDRYSHSGIAYSLAKGMERRWACQPEVGLPRPDLILFFDMNPERAKERGNFGLEVLEKSEFQQAVYAKMNELFDETYWRKIDADRPIEEVQKTVEAEIASLLERMAKSNKEESLAEFTAADFGM